MLRTRLTLKYPLSRKVLYCACCLGPQALVFLKIYVLVCSPPSAHASVVNSKRTRSLVQKEKLTLKQPLSRHSRRTLWFSPISSTMSKSGLHNYHRTSLCALSRADGAERARSVIYASSAQSRYQKVQKDLTRLRRDFIDDILDPQHTG